MCVRYAECRYVVIYISIEGDREWVVLRARSSFLFSLVWVELEKNKKEIYFISWIIQWCPTDGPFFSFFCFVFDSLVLFENLKLGHSFDVSMHSECNGMPFLCFSFTNASLKCVVYIPLQIDVGIHIYLLLVGTKTIVSYTLATAAVAQSNDISINVSRIASRLLYARMAYPQ